MGQGVDIPIDALTVGVLPMEPIIVLKNRRKVRQMDKNRPDNLLSKEKRKIQHRKRKILRISTVKIKIKDGMRVNLVVIHSNRTGIPISNGYRGIDNSIISANSYL